MYSAANGTENFDFVQNSDEIPQMVRKRLENGQKIMTKSENAAEDSEEETNTILLTLWNTLIVNFTITSKSF